jgi:hypothetical protein
VGVVPYFSVIGCPCRVAVCLEFVPSPTPGTVTEKSKSLQRGAVLCSAPVAFSGTTGSAGAMTMKGMVNFLHSWASDDEYITQHSIE